MKKLLKEHIGEDYYFAYGHQETERGTEFQIGFSTPAGKKYTRWQKLKILYRFGTLL